MLISWSPSQVVKTGVAQMLTLYLAIFTTYGKKKKKQNGYMRPFQRDKNKNRVWYGQIT